LARLLLNQSDVRELVNTDGYLTCREGTVLFYFAFNPTCRGRVVEIGSFKAKSTAWLAKGLQLAGISDRVVAIDPHINTRNIEVVPYYEEESSYRVFCANLCRMRLASWVEPVRATSEAAVKDWSEPVRLLFVDGSHRYEDVLNDFRLWEPFVGRNGIICVHDTNPMGPFVGVLKATYEYLGESNRFQEALRLKNLRVFRKLKPKDGTLSA